MLWAREALERPCTLVALDKNRFMPRGGVRSAMKNQYRADECGAW